MPYPKGLLSGLVGAISLQDSDTPSKSSFVDRQGSTSISNLANIKTTTTVNLVQALEIIALRSSGPPVAVGDDASDGSLLQCFLPPPVHTLKALQDSCRTVARPPFAPNPYFALKVSLGDSLHRLRAAEILRQMAPQNGSPNLTLNDRRPSFGDACLSRSQLIVARLVSSGAYFSSESYVAHYSGECAACAARGLPSTEAGSVWLSREEVATGLRAIIHEPGPAAALLDGEVRWGSHHASLWATGCLVDQLEELLPPGTLLSLLDSVLIPSVIPCDHPGCAATEGSGGCYFIKMGRDGCPLRTFLRRDRIRAQVASDESSPHLRHPTLLSNDAIAAPHFAADTTKGWFADSAACLPLPAETASTLAARWAQLSDSVQEVQPRAFSQSTTACCGGGDVPVIFNVPSTAPHPLFVAEGRIRCIGHFVSLRPFLPQVDQHQSTVAFVVDSMLDTNVGGRDASTPFGLDVGGVGLSLHLGSDLSLLPSPFSLHSVFQRYQAHVSFPLGTGCPANAVGYIRDGVSALLSLSRDTERDPFGSHDVTPINKPPPLRARIALKTVMEGFLPRVLGQHVAKALLLHVTVAHHMQSLQPAGTSRLIAELRSASTVGLVFPSREPPEPAGTMASVLVLGQDGSGKSLLLEELFEFATALSTSPLRGCVGDVQGDGGSSTLHVPTVVEEVDGSNDTVVVIPPQLSSVSPTDAFVIPSDGQLRSFHDLEAQRGPQIHMSRCSSDTTVSQPRRGAGPSTTPNKNPGSFIQTLEQALHTIVAPSNNGATRAGAMLLVDNAHQASPVDLFHLRCLAAFPSSQRRPVRVQAVSCGSSAPACPLLTVATSSVPTPEDPAATTLQPRLRKLLPCFPLVCFLDRELHDVYNQSHSLRVGSAHSLSVRNSASVGLRLSASFSNVHRSSGGGSSSSASVVAWDEEAVGSEDTRGGILGDLQAHLLRKACGGGGTGSHSVGRGGSEGGGSSQVDDDLSSQRSQELLALILNTPLYDYVSLGVLARHANTAECIHQSAVSVRIYEVFATPDLRSAVEASLISRFPQLGWQRAEAYLAAVQRDSHSSVPQHEAADLADLPTHISRCLAIIKARARIDMCGCWEVVMARSQDDPSVVPPRFVSTVEPLHIRDGLEMYCTSVQAGQWLLGAVTLPAPVAFNPAPGESGECALPDGDVLGQSTATSVTLADVVPASLAASGGMVASASYPGKRGRNAPAAARKLSKKDFIAGLVAHLHQCCPPGSGPKMLPRDRLTAAVGAYSQRCGAVAGVCMRGGSNVPTTDESLHILANEGLLIRVGPDSFKLTGCL